MSRVSTQLVRLNFLVLYTVTGGYSKYLTPAHPGHSRSEQSPEQGSGIPLQGQVLTLGLLDAGDSEGPSVDIKEAKAVNRNGWADGN